MSFRVDVALVVCWSVVPFVMFPDVWVPETVSYLVRRHFGTR